MTSKKIIISLVIILALATIGLGFLAYNQYSDNSNPLLQGQNIKWAENNSQNDYIKDCSVGKIVSHKQHLKCEENYMGKSIKDWKGYVIRVEASDQYGKVNYLTHDVIISVAFNSLQEQLLDRNQRDLQLTFDTKQAQIFEEIIINLKRGQQIYFSGVIQAIGNIQQIPHVHVLDIQEYQNGKPQKIE